MRSPQASRTAVAGVGRPGGLLERHLTADAPNRRRVAGITYVGIAAGWVHTAFVQDLFFRAIVGWQAADHLGADLALDALEKAIWPRGGIGGGLVHHFDHGVRYASIRCAERLDQIGAARSVGSTGDSFDNAAAESLNSLCKKEPIDFHDGWGNVTIATMEWVAWYGNERMHSYCGSTPPCEYEEAFHRSRGTTAPVG